MRLRNGAWIGAAMAFWLAQQAAQAQSPRGTADTGEPTGTKADASAPGRLPDAGPPDYFPRAAGDPAAIARGKQLYSANCAFCHGSDAHGGEVGPNLLRSPIVLNDRKGEVLGAVVLNGRVEKGMPKFNMSTENVGDVAAFLHSIDMRGEESGFKEKDILVGNAAAGKTYFNGKGGCKSCHSATGDLAGVGSKYGPKSLQDTLVTGGGTGMLGTPNPTARPRTVKVTLPGGATVEGRLLSVDDFNVSLTDADGNHRSFRRDGDVPRVEINNPFEAHWDLMKAGRDDDIHNLTAYLATLQ